jgi:hypothetical protein
MAGVFDIHSLPTELLGVVYSFTNHYEKRCTFPLVCKMWYGIAKKHQKNETIEQIFHKYLHQNTKYLTTREVIYNLFLKNKWAISLIETEYKKFSSFTCPGKVRNVFNQNNRYQAVYSGSVSFFQPIPLFFNSKSNKIIFKKTSQWKTYRINFQQGFSSIILTMNENDVILRQLKVFIVVESLEKKGIYKWNKISSNEAHPPEIDKKFVAAIDLSIKAQIKFLSKVNTEVILSKINKLEDFKEPFYFSTNKFGCIRTKNSNKIHNFFAIYLIELSKEEPTFRTLVCSHESADQNLNFFICWAIVIKATKLLAKKFGVEVKIDKSSNQFYL